MLPDDGSTNSIKLQFTSLVSSTVILNYTMLSFNYLHMMQHGKHPTISTPVFQPRHLYGIMTGTVRYTFDYSLTAALRSPATTIV